MAMKEAVLYLEQQGQYDAGVLSPNDTQTFKNTYDFLNKFALLLYSRMRADKAPDFEADQVLLLINYLFSGTPFLRTIDAVIVATNRPAPEATDTIITPFGIFWFESNYLRWVPFSSTVVKDL